MSLLRFIFGENVIDKPFQSNGWWYSLLIISLFCVSFIFVTVYIYSFNLLVRLPIYNLSSFLCQWMYMFPRIEWQTCIKDMDSWSSEVKKMLTMWVLITYCDHAIFKNFKFMLRLYGLTAKFYCQLPSLVLYFWVFDQWLCPVNNHTGNQGAKHD